MRRIRKGQYGFPIITISPKEYLNKGAEVLLKAMEPVGKAVTKVVAALPSSGPTAMPYFPTTVEEVNRERENLKMREKVFEEDIAPALSPSNHVVAWTQGSMNPKVGQRKIAEWGPLALLTSLGVDAIGFKYAPKAVKTASKATVDAAVDVAAKAGSKTAKKAVVAREINRGVNENTPKYDNRIRSIRFDNLIYDYSSNPLLELVKTIRTSPEESYFMRAPRKVDVAKLRNGRFRHEVVGNNILPSGEVDGKFVSYGEPWKEFGFGEESALYEFPVGPKRGPNMMATDWKGRNKGYSVNEAYDYMKLEDLLRKDLRLLKEQMGELFNKNYATIRNNLIESKYPLLKEHIDTSIYGGNQTVIPSLKWNFDNFLNSPFYKYTIDPISNQVQKELVISRVPNKSVEPRTSLKFFERKPFNSKLKKSEEAGVPKGERNNKQHGQTLAPYYDYSLINKHYEPWTVNEKGQFVFASPEESEKLGTIHFSMNEPVMDHFMGSWGDAPTITVMPYRNMRSQTPPVDIAIMDTFFPNYKGLKVSSRGSRTLTGDKATYDYYKSKGINVEFSPEMESLLNEMKDVRSKLNNFTEQEKYGFPPNKDAKALLDRENQLKEQIDEVSRKWARNNVKIIPNFEKLDEFGRAEGLDMDSYPYQLGSTGPMTTRASRELGLDYTWQSDPSNHSVFLQNPEYILKQIERGEYGKVRPEYIKYLKWAIKHKADYRVNPLEGFDGRTTLGDILGFRQ